MNLRARDSLFSAIHPLLKVIGVYTGCYVTLLAAAVPSSSNGEKDYFSAYVTTSLSKKPSLNYVVACTTYQRVKLPGSTGRNGTRMDSDSM